MKEEELIKELENVDLPEIKLENHRVRLKAALLAGRFNKEGTFMDTVKTQSAGLFDIVFAPQPAWKVAATTVVAILALFGAFISIPQTSAIIKSTLFPEGSRQISGPQLTAEEQNKATVILKADPSVKELLSQGAVIDKILPIQVTAETLDPQTGTTRLVQETWAQAWLVRGSQDWGIQIDLVKGRIISITPSAGN